MALGHGFERARCWDRALPFWTLQHITDTWTGYNKTRVGRVAFQLAPQIADISAQVVKVVAIFTSPYGCQKLLVQYDLIWVAGQLVEQTIFGSR